MLSIAERHKFILEELKKNGFIRASDLAKELDVTVVTIRKDLKYLESRKLLCRIHGSASPVSRLNVPDVSVHVKEKIKSTEKAVIGKRAFEMIEPDDSIILASGSTVYALAEQINSLEHLNVVTPSLRISMLLCGLERVKVLQLGGELHRKSLSVRGEYAAKAFDELTCSKLFIGVDGIDLGYGITTSNIDEARLSVRMMEAASQTVVLADSSKFGQRGFGRICSLEQIDVIITDSGITPSMKKMVEEAGVKLIIAE